MRPQMTRTNFLMTIVIGLDILWILVCRLHGRLMRGGGGYSEGETRPRANHTSMVETTLSTLDSSSTFADTGVFSKEEVDTIHRLMSGLETSATPSSFAHTSNLAIALVGSMRDSLVSGCCLSCSSTGAGIGKGLLIENFSSLVLSL
jgi:hypothetical protein